MQVHIVSVHIVCTTPPENRQELLKDCDRLVKMEISREEILNDVETVDSTTDVEPSPAKKPRTAKCDAKKARMSAARGRAKTLLSSRMSCCFASYNM